MTDVVRAFTKTVEWCTTNPDREVVATGERLEEILSGPLIPAYERPVFEAKLRAVPRVTEKACGGLGDFAPEGTSEK